MSSPTKSQAGRRLVPIAAQVEAPLQRLIKQGDRRRTENPDDGDERLVVTGSRGGSLHYNAWRKALDAARKASGVRYTTHERRHVAASLAIRSGMSDTKVATMMGHANAAYTRKAYGHLFSADGRIVAGRLSAVIEQLHAAEQELAVLRAAQGVAASS